MKKSNKLEKNAAYTIARTTESEEGLATGFERDNKTNMVEKDRKENRSKERCVGAHGLMELGM